MSAERTAGAVAGGLLAGLALSAVMLVGEKLSGKPSELIELERRTAARLGIGTRQGEAPATRREQLVTHGGHLALSALAGLAYAATVDEDEDGVASGAAFGAAFFVAAYGLTGPLLGARRRPGARGRCVRSSIRWSTRCSVLRRRFSRGRRAGISAPRGRQREGSTASGRASSGQIWPDRGNASSVLEPDRGPSSSASSATAFP